VIAAAVLVLALAGTAVAALLARGGTDAPAARRVGVLQDKPGPVLLVPGYGGGTASLDRLAETLRATGRTAIVIHLPGGGTGDLRVQARAVGVAARSALAGGAPSVDVVGYSAGGVVVRLWVRDDGGAAVTRRVVTLGSPHHGTDVAALAVAVVGSACPTACRQLTPGSPLLDRLNAADETPAGPRWESIWTTGDELVTPADSARLTGAVDVAVQDVCRGRQVTHGQLPTDPAVQQLVLEALGTEPPHRPAGCPV
jgi:triacylglycerol esterase/lipase EstA (alpha/beta hydrolase family)